MRCALWSGSSYASLRSHPAVAADSGGRQRPLKADGDRRQIAGDARLTDFELSVINRRTGKWLSYDADPEGWTRNLGWTGYLGPGFLGSHPQSRRGIPSTQESTTRVKMTLE